MRVHAARSRPETQAFAGAGAAEKYPHSPEMLTHHTFRRAATWQRKAAEWQAKADFATTPRHRSTRLQSLAQLDLRSRPRRPFPAVEKALRDLKREGLAKSSRGGGKVFWRLADSPQPDDGEAG